MTTIATKLGAIYFDDQGTRDQPTALLWPSLFTDFRMWRHQIAALRWEGWRTLAVDPPGHGRSLGLDRTFTMDECTEVALAVLDAAAVRAPAVVLGTSWGGFVSFRMALHAPNRVKGMILFNTSAEASSTFSKAQGALLARLIGLRPISATVERMALEAMLAPDTRKRHPEIKNESLRELTSWSRPALVQTIRSVIVDRAPVLDDLAALRVPALIVSGQKDKLLPTPYSLRIVAKLPNARHIQVPGAAHLVPLEAPQIANSLILEFLRQLPV